MSGVSPGPQTFRRFAGTPGREFPVAGTPSPAPAPRPSSCSAQAARYPPSRSPAPASALCRAPRSLLRTLLGPHAHPETTAASHECLPELGSKDRVGTESTTDLCVLVLALAHALLELSEVARPSSLAPPRFPRSECAHELMRGQGSEDG
eukprot:2727716-Rhodomonas_salina.5